MMIKLLILFRIEQVDWLRENSCVSDSYELDCVGIPAKDSSSGWVEVVSGSLIFFFDTSSDHRLSQERERDALVFATENESSFGRHAAITQRTGSHVKLHKPRDEIDRFGIAQDVPTIHTI